MALTGVYHEQQTQLDTPMPQSLNTVNSEPGLGYLLEHAPDAIFIESLDGYVLDVNKQACRLHGMTREELVGIHVLELVPEDQRDLVQREYSKFVEGRMQMYEGFSLHKSGRRIPVELITTQILYNSQPALLIHARDLSTRKALHQSDALNEAIMQVLPGGVIRHDAQKRIVFANEQAIKFFCLQFDEQERCYQWSEHCKLLLEDNTKGNLKSHWPGYRCMDLLQREEETTLGIQCQCGTESWGVFSAMPVVDQQTRLCLGAVVSFIDTTQQRKTMTALRESEYRFHLAFDHAPMGMVLATPDGKFLQINNRFCRMLGYRWSELIDKTFFDIAPDMDTDTCKKFAEMLTNSAATRHSTKKRYLHKDGHEVWCQITVTVVRDAQGKPQYCINQIEDLSPQLKAQQQHEQLEDRLRQAQKLQAIGTLASGVAHDFNNLLLAIESYLDMAQTQYDKGQDPTKALKNIHQAIRQSTGMTRSLLTFARQTNGHRQHVDLMQIIEQSLQTLKPLIPATIKVQVMDKTQCPLQINADPSEIQQLLMNLVVNARDAMPDGGTLSLILETESCEGRRPLLNLWVCDTGVGMDEQTRQRLFDPFYTTKSRSQGTGLGLAVAHGIITDHQARIRVQSEPGNGTRFKITFPGINCLSTTAPSDTTIAAGHRHMVLVQTDDMLKQVLQTMLSDQQVTVHGVADMQHLETLLIEEPDLVIDLLVCDDVPGNLPTESICKVLQERQPDYKWVLMTDRNTPPTPMAYASHALLLRQPMPMRELAGHLLEILNGISR
ncbi:MAG TPA: hypothetical protein DCM28_14450 [Phycisphaerales bacterium]|nr:hypothetical protein [Phycisphaerales bacterium]